MSCFQTEPFKWTVPWVFQGMLSDLTHRVPGAEESRKSTSEVDCEFDRLESPGFDVKFIEKELS